MKESDFDRRWALQVKHKVWVSIDSQTGAFGVVAQDNPKVWLLQPTFKTSIEAAEAWDVEATIRSLENGPWQDEVAERELKAVARFLRNVVMPHIPNENPRDAQAVTSWFVHHIIWNAVEMLKKEGK